MKKRIIRAALMVLAVISVFSVAFVFPSFAENNAGVEASMLASDGGAKDEALASGSLTEVLAGPGGGASGGGFGGGVTGQRVDIRGLVSKIAYRACAFIMAATVIYGCWSLYEGFTLPLRKRDWCRSSEARLCAA